MAHINSVIAYSNTTTTVTIGPGTAIGSGNGIAGFVNVYTGGVTGLSLTATGVAGSNTLTIPVGVTELIGISDGNYYFSYYGIGLTGAPTTAVFTIGGLGANTVTFGGGVWDEFSTELAAGKALDAKVITTYPGTTTTTANATTTASQTTLNVSELVYSWANGQGTNFTAGTSPVFTAGATDNSSQNYGEYLTHTAVSAQGVWTAATAGVGAALGLMTFGTPAVSCAKTGPLLGVGCSIGWRAALLAGAAWRVGKAIERNEGMTRRGLIMLRWRSLIGHNGGPALDE